MKSLKRSFPTLLLALALVLPPSRAAAQAFGFGTDPAAEDPAAAPDRAAAPAALTVHGRLVLGAVLFPEDLTDPGTAKPENASAADLTLAASGSSAHAELRLEVTEAALDAETAADFLDEAVEEAFLRLFLGSVTMEGGIRKLTWGKADSQGPLDVVNPFDLTDLTVTDELERRIARPLVRVSWAAGPMTQVEAVFLPSFEPHSIAFTGRWQPSEVRTLLLGYVFDPEPDTSTLDYAQGGLRFTTTTGSVDWGFQYFHGFLPMPVFRVTAPPPSTVGIVYNRYHQAGADLAAVLGGFNLRAEAAANLTEDFDGDDPYVYNPHLAFSLGADRDVWKGINLNLQYAGTIRLADGGIASPFDVETDTAAFRSGLTAVAFQKLLRDKLEWRAAAIWNLADADFLVLPSLSWTEGDAEVKVAAGIFGGDEAGQMGQYAENSWVRLTLTYTF